jgi:hypothetical protein
MNETQAFWKRESVKWYVTTLAFVSDNQRLADTSGQYCVYLVAASDHDDAYEKSRQHGIQLSRQESYFIGVKELLQVYDAPDDCSELTWSEIELPKAELPNEVKPKWEMQAFRISKSSPSGWYVGKVVLEEVHDEGAHGENILVWINSYLVRAPDADAAHAKAIKIGEGQEDEPGAHICDGKKAHWHFVGIQDLVPVHETPGDISLLWFEEAKFSSDGGSTVPKKTDLGVFRWQAEQIES